MSDAAEPWVQHFTVSYADDELWSFRKLLSKQPARRDDGGRHLGLQLLALFAIGLVIAAVFKLGLIDATALNPVLFAGGVAYVAGVASNGYEVRRQLRASYRSLARGSGAWHYSFDDTGISYKSDLRQTHLRWRAVSFVGDFDRAVMFVSGEQAIFLPSRAFSDATMRTTFVAAAAARIKAAHETPKT